MFNDLKGSTVLVTGATGLIGQAVVRRLIREGANVLAVVRDREKAIALFGPEPGISYIVSDITVLRAEDAAADYIVHGASVTSSTAFVRDPVGVTQTALEGTLRVLEAARRNEVKGLVFLSSMEVYGAPRKEEKIDESHGSDLDPMAVRSAYPESKRMCESLCASWHAQFKVPAGVIRLTQTFGPGVRYDDPRVFAEFARCAIEGRDIVLHTRGETKRSYLYTEDAASAILTVLTKGVPGEAYNAANEESYCSILEMARLVAGECAGGGISVRIEPENDLGAYGYAPVLRMDLDTRKLRALGWKPTVGLKEMFNRMIADMRSRRI